MADRSTLSQAKRLAAPRLRLATALQALRLVLRLGFLDAAAFVAGHAIMDGAVENWALLALPALLAASALAGVVADRHQAGLETRLAASVRRGAGAKLQKMAARHVRSIPAGRLAVAMQRHPEAVAGLAVGHRIASRMMALGPLAAVCLMLLVSWQAALTLVLLTPVMIVFFALVGDTIRRLARRQEEAFGELAGQFADRIRTLPTILANHATDAESAKLRDRLDGYAAGTMRVLRIAFINAGIIDFFSSLSIALLAVFLGLGQLKLVSIPGFSGLQLWQSLLILVAAPDYFAPFRRFAEQYHVKAEGDAAAAALDELLTVREPSKNEPAKLDLDHLPAHGLVAVTGASGSGKSTLLRRLAGIETCCSPLAGQIAGSRITWISTDAFVPDGPLDAAIAWNAGPSCPTHRLLAAGKVGLLDDALLPGGLGARIEESGANLSGGQRMRIAIARALLTQRSVFADEPTAKLDARSAALVRRALHEMAATRLVVVATHDAELVGLASRTIHLCADDHAKETAQ